MREFKKKEVDESVGSQILQAEKALSGAKIALLCRFPLFGEIAIRMVMKPTFDIPTTAVDPHMTLWYNPMWVNALSPVDQLSSVAHEVGHVLQSVFSRTPKNPLEHIWNIATDYHVDTTNHDAGIQGGEWRKSKCTEEVRKQAHEDKISEITYRRLLEKMEHSKCPACAELAKRAMSGGLTEAQEGGEGQGKELPEHTCGQESPCCTASMMAGQKMTEREKVETKIKWEQIVTRAAMAQKSRGNLPGVVEEFLASLSKPQVRWTDYIRLMATSVFKDRYSYYIRSRRSYAMGMILPGRTKALKGAVGCFDTSGSMSDGEINASLSEFVGLMEQCGCPKLEVIFHDSIVYYHGEAGRADLAKMNVQRGGTDHRPVFEILNDRKRSEKPALVVCFTDLMTCFPDTTPGYPVLWCCPEEYKEHEVPWGQKIPIDMSTLRVKE